MDNRPLPSYNISIKNLSQTGNKRKEQILMKTPTLKVTPVVTVSIINTLRSVGVPASILGYEYLKYGVSIILEDPTIINRMTSDLYPTIAKGYETTPSRVERAIRHAVEVSFMNSDPDEIQKNFGNTVRAYKGKLSNSEYMSAIAEMVRLEVGAYGTMEY